MKLLLRHNQKTFRFLGFKQTNDWSLIVTWDRKRESSTAFRYSFSEMDPIEFSSPTEQMWLTYHTSGRVNYHGWVRREPAYYEPLSNVSNAQLIIAVSIPTTDGLTELDRDPCSSDFIVDLANDFGRERFTIGILITPRNFESLPNILARIDYDLFSALVVHLPNPRLFDRLDQHFHYFGFDGSYPAQPLTRNVAMLAYHQRRVGSTDLWIYPPNGEGIYELYTSVEMRCIPRVFIEFNNPALRFEVDESRARAMMIPFSIFCGMQRVTSGDLRMLITRIELDSEL